MPSWNEKNHRRACSTKNTLLGGENRGKADGTLRTLNGWTIFPDSTWLSWCTLRPGLCELLIKAIPGTQKKRFVKRKNRWYESRRDEETEQNSRVCSCLNIFFLSSLVLLSQKDTNAYCQSRLLLGFLVFCCFGVLIVGGNIDWSWMSSGRSCLFLTWICGSCVVSVFFSPTQLIFGQMHPPDVLETSALTVETRQAPKETDPSIHTLKSLNWQPKLSKTTWIPPQNASNN